MKTSLWIVLLVVVAWVAFLIGYSVSALTGMQTSGRPAPAIAAGYGTARGAQATPATKDSAPKPTQGDR